MRSYTIESVYSTETKKINNKSVTIRQVLPMFFPSIIIGVIIIFLQSRKMGESLVPVLNIIFSVSIVLTILGAVTYLIYRLLEKNKINKICKNSIYAKAEVFNVKYITKKRNRNRHGRKVAINIKYYGFDIRFNIEDKMLVRSISKMFREPVINAINDKQTIDILYSKKDNKVLLIDEVLKRSYN